MFKDDMMLLTVSVFILINYRLDCPKIRIIARSWAMPPSWIFPKSARKIWMNG